MGAASFGLDAADSAASAAPLDDLFELERPPAVLLAPLGLVSLAESGALDLAFALGARLDSLWLCGLAESPPPPVPLERAGSEAEDKESRVALFFLAGFSTAVPSSLTRFELLDFLRLSDGSPLASWLLLAASSSRRGVGS